MSDHGLKQFGCLGCCGVTILSCVLFGLSFATIHPLEMGIALNNNIMHMDTSQTYFGGRLFVGIGRTFIKFPITLQTVYLGNWFDKDSRNGDSVKCRTLDGMVIYTDVSLSYAIKREPQDLIRLYRDVGDGENGGWEDLYTKMTQHAIRDVTSKFMAFQFFTERNVISESMKTRINTDLQRVYADVHQFELVNMEIPDTFGIAIEMTQVAAQDILQARAENQVAIIDAQSELAVRTAQSEILVKNADADAFALLRTAEAKAASIKAHMESQVAGFKQLAIDLNMTTKQLLAYQFVTTVQESAASDFLLNMPYPAALQMS